MDERDLKAAAVENLLGEKAGPPTANPFAAKLGAAFAKKEPGRLPDFEKIRRNVLARRDAAEADRRRFRRIWVPAAAAATVLIIAGSFLIRPYLSQPTPAVTAQAIEIPKGKAEKLRLEDSLAMHVRSAGGLTRTLNGNALTLKAATMSALFDFEPNDRLRAVKIETPRATFSVIGTRFIIQADGDTAFLAVESGAVRVNAAGKEYVVRGGEFWSETKAVQKTGKTGENGRKLFPAFITERDPAGLVRAIAAKTETAPAPRGGKRVVVTLKSGTVVSGILISESAEGVEMRAAAAGNQVLRFTKDEIAGIQYPK